MDREIVKYEGPTSKSRNAMGNTGRRASVIHTHDALEIILSETPLRDTWRDSIHMRQKTYKMAPSAGSVLAPGRQPTGLEDSLSSRRAVEETPPR